MPKFHQSCKSCGDTVTSWDTKHEKWDCDSHSESSDECCDRNKCDGWKNRKWNKCCPEKKRSCCVKAWDFKCEDKCNSCWRQAVRCGGCLGCAGNVTRCLNPKYTWWNEWYPRRRCACSCKCHH